MMGCRASHDYALQVCCRLARSGGVVSSRVLSDDIGVSRGYLIQLAHGLRVAGIVGASEGRSGGYALLMDPREVTALAIIGAVDPPRAGDGDTGPEAARVVREASRAVARLTLAELAGIDARASSGPTRERAVSANARCGFRDLTVAETEGRNAREGYAAVPDEGTVR